MKSKSLSIRIFATTFFAGALVYLVCAFVFTMDMHSYFERQIFSELETESSLLSEYVLKGGAEEIEKLGLKNRVTLIHSDGTVYFDNTVDFKTMENHAGREEFAGAVQKGTFQIERYSTTMMEKTKK